MELRRFVAPGCRCNCQAGRVAQNPGQCSILNGEGRVVLIARIIERRAVGGQERIRMRSDEIRGDVIPVPEGNHRLSSRTSDVIAVADAAKVIGLHIQAVRRSAAPLSLTQGPDTCRPQELAHILWDPIRSGLQFSMFQKELARRPLNLLAMFLDKHR